MRALVQRVSHAAVRVGGEPVASIGPGLLVLLGVTHDDDEATADRLADKVRAAGYLAVPVELSELKRGGGSVKCAVAELRH